MNKWDAMSIRSLVGMYGCLILADTTQHSVVSALLLAISGVLMVMYVYESWQARKER